MFFHLRDKSTCKYDQISPGEVSYVLIPAKAASASRGGSPHGKAAVNKQVYAK